MTKEHACGAVWGKTGPATQGTEESQVTEGTSRWLRPALGCYEVWACEQTAHVAHATRDTHRTHARSTRTPGSVGVLFHQKLVCVAWGSPPHRPRPHRLLPGPPRANLQGPRDLTPAVVMLGGRREDRASQGRVHSQASRAAVATRTATAWGRRCGSGSGRARTTGCSWNPVLGSVPGDTWPRWQVRSHAACSRGF